MATQLKVHRRDMKKIPMTEKVCQLYEEEQVGKTREGRKAVSANKMPELGLDIAETQLTQLTQESSENRKESHMTLTLQTIITVIIMIITSLEHITAHAMKIPTAARKTAHTITSTITKVSHNKFLQNIKDSYKTALLAITIATNMKDRTNHRGKPNKNNRNMQNFPGTQKLNDEYDDLYQSHISRTHNSSSN